MTEKEIVQALRKELEWKDMVIALAQRKQEEIKSAFTTDTLIKLAAQALETTPERLRELAAADKDGRVVVLPCKVYETDGERVYEHTVREVIYETAGGPAFDKNAIGKSIFLTRAEAERAMEGNG